MVAQGRARSVQARRWCSRVLESRPTSAENARLSVSPMHTPGRPLEILYLGHYTFPALQISPSCTSGAHAARPRFSHSACLKSTLPAAFQISPNCTRSSCCLPSPCTTTSSTQPSGIITGRQWSRKAVGALSGPPP